MPSISKTKSHILGYEDAHRHVTSVVDTIIGGEFQDEEKQLLVKPLRSSREPICNILEAFNLINNGYLEGVRKVSVNNDFKTNYYTNIGTAVHLSYQKFGANIDKIRKNIFGRWKCSCGKVFKGPQFAPEICIDCEVAKKAYNFTYIEVDYNYKGKFTGHTDLLTHTDDIGFVAWDFKTSAGLKEAWKRKYLPYQKNKLQVEDYCFLFEEQYFQPIQWMVLVYVDRSKHDLYHICGPYKINQLILDKAKARIELAIIGQDSMIKAFDSIEKGVIKDDSVLESFLKHRPCYHMPYDEYMKHGFFGKETCPLIKECIPKDNNGKIIKYPKSLIDLITDTIAKKGDKWIK